MRLRAVVLSTFAALVLAGCGYAAPEADAALESPVACKGCKKFKATTSPWQWQLTGAVDTSVDAKVFDIDGLKESAAVVQQLRAKGRRVICYVSVGSYEPFRADAASFPPEVLGRPLEGFEDERWLDIRQIAKLAPIIRGRFKICKDKGFHAVEPDNVDGYQNKSGFRLKASDQLRYNAWFANEAHRMGLAVGLKNDIDQVKRLQPYFDFAVVEQCFQYDECEGYSAFIDKDKAVFETEYELQPRKFCRAAKALGFSAIYKDLDLTAKRKTCG